MIKWLLQFESFKALYWLVWEWLKTYSNKPSFFASKRIERSLFIVTGVTLICYYVYHRINDLSPEGLLIIVAPLFAYAGFNLIHTQREKKNKDEKTDINRDSIPDSPSNEQLLNGEENNEISK